MRKQVVSLILVFVASLGAWGQAAGEGAPATEAAVVAARAWLALTDSGKYAESWQQAASYLQKAVETVTPMRCEDGAWRVSGYFIQ